MKLTKTTPFSKLMAAAVGALLAFNTSQAQILFSSGSPYTQNFDTALAASAAWTDNTTISGWYAARAVGSLATYNFGTGSGTTGGLWSFGVAGVNAVTDRALGSLCSNGTGAIAYGLRFTNDTSVTITNVVISYKGEQWRNGGNTTPQTLVCSYFKNGAAITSPDALNANVWTSVSGLTFTTPINTATGAALDGNDSPNRAVLTTTVSGLTIGPGEEIFFRWFDANDSGNDHGVSLDDLSITWSTIAPNNNPPSITQQPVGATNYAGNNASFSVQAIGKAPLSYQWYYTNAGNNVLISGATASSFALSMITNDNAGQYYVIITNDVPGAITSSVVKLVVKSAVVTNIAYLHTLQDANFALTDTNTLYQITGIVTTPNLVQGGTVYSFYIQDATGGIDVFHRGGFAALGQINSDLPAVGQIVTVTAPLAQFQGFIEVSPIAANPAHSLVLSNNDVAIYPLPAPVTFDLASQSNFPLMESTYEGLRVQVFNVTLDNSAGSFAASGTTNWFSITNSSLVTMTGFVPGPANDVHGQTFPPSAYSIIGVITQGKGSSPFTGSYILNLTSYADLNITGSLAPVLNLQATGSTLALSWTGTAVLQCSTNVAGPYVDVPSATSPFTTNAAASSTPIQFFRLYQAP